MKSWELLAKCSQCGAEKIKRRDEMSTEREYMCITCFRQKRGKILGNKYGKTQKKKGKCKNCNNSIPSTKIYCKQLKCQDAKSKSISNRMTGDNNPAWTGNHVCECGVKKSFGAKQCRSCSFKNNKRGGPNNGRYVSENRKEFLANKKSITVARTILSNFLKTQNVKKTSRTEKMLKYSFSEFKKHITDQFEPWMSWENHGQGDGKWQIDHIAPISYLVQIGIHEPHLVNALCNLRPLCATANVRKSNSLIDQTESIINKLLEMRDNTNT